MNIREALRLREQGRTNTQIAATATVACARSTIVELFKRCDKAGIGYGDCEQLSDTELVTRLYPNKHKAVRQASELNESYWQSEHDRSGKEYFVLWEEYIEQYPAGLSYGQFCARLRSFRLKQGQQLSYPKQRKAGETMETDWCGDKLSNLYDANSHSHLEVSFFVAAIGFSTRIYARAYLNQKEENWLDAHTKAIEYFGAVPAVIQPDNTRTAITKSNRYEPSKHPSFALWARHYDVAIVPARVRKPKDKDRVEDAVGAVTATILPQLKDQLFFRLDDLNRELLRLVEKYNNKPYQQRTGCRNDLFNTIDLPHMRPLPREPFKLSESKWITLPKKSYHIFYDNHQYSAPHQLAGEKLLLSATDTTIELLYDNKRVALHQRSYELDRYYVTAVEHMPPHHQAQREADELTTADLLDWSQATGESTTLAIQAILSQGTPLQESRLQCLGVLRLTDRHSADLVERACQQAVESGEISFLRIASHLTTIQTAVQRESRNHHANLRGSQSYKENTHE